MMGFLKLWSFLSNEKRWRSIIDQAVLLENEQINSNSLCDYESDDEEKHSFAKHIDSYTRNIFMISCNVKRIYIFTVTLYIVSPFLEYAIYRTTGRDASMPHVLPGWSPLDSYTVGYLVTILVEIVAALYCVKVHVAFDLTVVGLMIFIRGQFSCLHKYSELIGGQGKSSNIQEKRDKRAYYRIIKCHSIHVLLINTIHELETLLRKILGIYFFVATLTLCSVAVQLNEDQVSTTQLISLLQYMGASLTQLFLFCRYGDAVLNESSVGQGQGPFCSARWCLSPKVHREMAILGAGMSRPYRIRAGPFNSLNLPSFIQIIRTAYSYYAILRQT
ncbi:odorant receptor 67c-like [Vanessa cardui]|uniref:odorant receptor 67c-like n=1 Tax=Vanessa cardui TaxID=171605 RepID=UPI001F13E826|nr:odorant receptor 67c-like [Vanessa cardui]